MKIIMESKNVLKLSRGLKARATPIGLITWKEEEQFGLLMSYCP